jgi:NADH:ubiquinone oxidoreductase subunit 2 (subunit N)
MMQGRDLTSRERWIYAAIGLSVWLNGAVTFRLGGAFLFESGPVVMILVATFISVAVCLIFRSTMRWRGTRQDEALTVAVIMALPGLFGEAAREALFTWATGLEVSAAPRFAATMFLGNAVLIAYATIKMYRARAPLRPQ